MFEKIEGIKTNYIEKKNEEKNGIELYFDTIPTAEEREILKNNGYRWNKVSKCWYIKSGSEKKTDINNLKLKVIRKATDEEVEKIVAKLWESKNMQEYTKKRYDFYKLSDNHFFEFEKTSKIAIDKTLYYDDELDDIGNSEETFINYNKMHLPHRNFDDYLENVKSLKENGCASGRYKYDEIDLYCNYYNNDEIVNFNVYYDTPNEYIRPMTEDEKEDLFKLVEYRQEQYIARLKRYYKRYGSHVHSQGYWANR